MYGRRRDSSISIQEMIIKKFGDSFVKSIVKLVVQIEKPKNLERAMAVARENKKGPKRDRVANCHPCYGGGCSQLQPP